MPLKLMTRPRVEPVLGIDTPDDIAEMMAEAARVDAMFQSGAISTLFPSVLAAASMAALADVESTQDVAGVESVETASECENPESGRNESDA